MDTDLKEVIYITGDCTVINAKRLAQLMREAKQGVPEALDILEKEEEDEPDDEMRTFR